MSQIDIINYRRYAADCLDLAQRVSSDADRLSLLEMAARWYDLAAKMEKQPTDDPGDESLSSRLAISSGLRVT
jgi:hypothetical protein